MIYLLWCTIRPEMFNETCKYWMDYAKEIDNIVNIIAVRTIEQQQILINYGYENIIVVPEKGYNTAATYLTKNIYEITNNEIKDNDIIMLPTDDFYPQYQDWDYYILNKFKDYDGALFLNDGKQELVKEGCLCITLACMTYSCLKKLNGIIFHPDYTHFFSDNEAFNNLTELKLLKDDRDIDYMKFEHKRFNRKSDESDVEHVQNFGVDQEKFQERMQLSVYERLGF